jgi:hypothetical protein
MTLAKASVLANPSVSDSDFLTVTHTHSNTSSHASCAVPHEQCPTQGDFEPAP